jgi:hypothetical protein
LDGGTGGVTLKAVAKDGTLQETIHMSAPDGNIYVGGNDKAGDIFVYPSSVKGADTTNGTKASIRLDGEKGDIVLQNADCAEEFDVVGADEIAPGTVMVLDREGRLRQSTTAYDKNVAGVIAGAGNCKPGIILGNKPSHEQRLPLALVGKVYCKADAEYSEITVGDLLTTSPTPGHAMKALDALRAFGAVIGEALGPLERSSGLIPILAFLQ